MAKKLGRPLKRSEFVHHKDHDERNNDLDNLEIVTPREHNRLHGKIYPGESNPMSKLTEKDVKAIRKSQLTNGRLAFMYGVSESTISLVRRRKNWRGVR